MFQSRNYVSINIHTTTFPFKQLNNNKRPRHMPMET
jgi:hypothetical protein